MISNKHPPAPTAPSTKNFQYAFQSFWEFARNIEELPRNNSQHPKAHRMPPKASKHWNVSTGQGTMDQIVVL